MSNEKTDAAFSVRLPESEKEVLSSLARLSGTNTAALARRYIREGIDRELDPIEIARKVDQRKERLIAATAEFRERRNHTNSNPQ